MKKFPTIRNTQEEIYNLLNYIVKERNNDVRDFDNLKNIFISGRKVTKIPADASDVVATDRVGDFNYDNSYIYLCLNNGVDVVWRTAPLTDFTTNAGGGGSAAWGAITGTLTDQVDIVNALNAKANTADIFSGDYNDLSNTPAIPTNNNQLTNGAGYITTYTVTLNDVLTALTYTPQSGDEFEAVSKNLNSYNATPAYNLGDLASITYDIGGGDQIVKTLNYSELFSGTSHEDDYLTSVVLSGDLPSGVTQTTKTLAYSVLFSGTADEGAYNTGVTYS